jgi:hypothetical protein
MSSRIRILISWAMLAVFAVAALAQSAPPPSAPPPPAAPNIPGGQIPAADDLSRNVWKVPGDANTPLAVRIVVQPSSPGQNRSGLVSTREMVTTPGGRAPQWRWVARRGDAAQFNQKFRPNPPKVDFGQAGNVMDEMDVRSLVTSFQYRGVSPENVTEFQTSVNEYKELIRTHRAKTFFSAGLPCFAWDKNNGRTSPERRVKGPFAIFNSEPASGQPANIANGVVNFAAFNAAAYDYIRTRDAGFLSGAGIASRSVTVDNQTFKVYRFAAGEPFYGFKAFQMFAFQMNQQVTSPTVQPVAQRVGRNGPGLESLNLPRVAPGVTDFDAVPPGDLDTARARIAELRDSQRYVIKTSGGANSGNLDDYKYIDIEDPATWTVEYSPDALAKFDPQNEGTRTQASFDRAIQAWMDVVCYVDGHVVGEDGLSVGRFGPYVFTQFIYMEPAVRFIPATPAAARGLNGPPVSSLPGSGPGGSVGLRGAHASIATAQFGVDADPGTFNSQPVQMYRGWPRIGAGESLGDAGSQSAATDGELDPLRQVQQASTLCRNMALSLATRYRYNPGGADPTTPPPSDAAAYETWLDQNFPNCISYYPPYKNRDNVTIGPYVRKAKGFASAGDRYDADAVIPGSTRRFGSLYRIIKFSGNLLAVVNFLHDHTGQQTAAGFTSAEELSSSTLNQSSSYGSGASQLGALGYQYAWVIDFDPAAAVAQNTSGSTGSPCEVIRVPLLGDTLRYVSEIFPLHPGMPTQEQQTDDTLVHKAMQDAKLYNGAGILGDPAFTQQPDTTTPGLGRSDFIYAVVGNCCGPTVLLSGTLSTGNRPKQIGAQNVQMGPRPSSVCIISSEQGQGATAARQEEALGVPSGFEFQGAGGVDTGQPANIPGASGSISSRLASSPTPYQGGAYSNLAREVGVNFAPGSLQNPTYRDAAGQTRSLLEASGTYVSGQRYFFDICAEAAVAPSVIPPGVTGNATGQNIVAYFIKQIRMELTAPNRPTPEKTKVLYNVENPGIFPSDPPCAREEFVPREDGEYTLRTTVVDFNNVDRVTTMRIAVRPAGTGVEKISGEGERK